MNQKNPLISRRQALWRSGMGMGALGLAGVLRGVGAMQARRAIGPSSRSPLAFRPPHFAARAKRVIHLFMNGGPSQLDSFDPKPLLKKWAGKPIPVSFRTERKTGTAFPSPFSFKKYGQSGLEVSELFPYTAEMADHLCVIRSMQTDLPNHEPSLMMMNCGEVRMARPSMGSWVTYALGSENQNLPGFVVLCPNGYPVQGTENWRSGFLPGAFQGTYIDTAHTDVEKLIEDIKHNYSTPEDQRRQLSLLAALNRRHQATRQEDPAIEARIQAYELAARMQLEAVDAFDISREPAHDSQRPTATPCTAADAHGTAIDRKRGALCSGLSRRHPALGQPRQSRGAAPQPGPRLRPADRRPAQGPRSSAGCSTKRW